MKRESRTEYPASAEVVLRMMTDKDFHTRKLEALGIARYRVLEHAFDGRRFHIRIERKVPVQAPGMLKKMAPAETVVIQDETWDLGTRTGTVRAEPRGMPVELRCDATVADTPRGCSISYVWNIDAKVPLMGGTLEKFIAGDMDRREAEENEAALRLLDAYR